MIGYEAKIKEASKDLTAREKLLMKDTSNAQKLDSVVLKGESLVIAPDAYAVLDIHNEKADDKDYQTYIILDKDGNKYYTGSESFWSSFIEIWDAMEGEGEDYKIDIHKMPSKNYTGKEFLTCSIV